jgi:hypothetical protein
VNPQARTPALHTLTLALSPREREIRQVRSKTLPGITLALSRGERGVVLMSPLRD